MKLFAAIVGLSLIGVGSTAYADPPEITYQPAPELAPFFDKAFGAKFKLAGPPQIMAPDQSAHLFNFFSLRPALSVPVAFKQTARLEEDVAIKFQPNQKDPLILHKGTTLYHTVFLRNAAESRPIDAWCGVTSWHMWGDHFTTQCLVKTPDGKGVAYSGDTWRDYDERFTMENVKGGVHAPHWFAFGLNDATSLPFDYPAITETDLPSPDMAIILRFDRPIKDKTSGQYTLLATWALRGPDGDIPTTGPLVSFEIPVLDGQIRIPMFDHLLEAKYDPDEKVLSAMKVTAADMTAVKIEGSVAPPAPVPPAPITDEPWLFGSMKIDPATVTVAKSPLAAGDVLLSANGHLSLRYRLKTAAHSGFYYYDAGIGVYRSEYTGYEANGEKYKIAAWCGPGESRPMGTHFKVIICTPANRNGAYGSYFIKNWELIGYMSNPRAPADVMDLDLEPDPDPAPETRQFQMRIIKIDAKAIGLKLGLLTDDHFTMQEIYELPFDETGSAKLYLWDRVIAFSYQQGQVSATVLPGAGQGPRYGKAQVAEGGY